MAGVLDTLGKKDGFTDIKVGSETYSVELLDADVAFEVSNTLFTVFAPVVTSALDGFRREEVIMPDESTLFTEIGMQLSNSLHRLDVKDVVDKLLFNVTSHSKGRIDSIGKHFKGNLTGYAQLVTEVIKANFGDYFLDLFKGLGLEIPTLTEMRNLFNKEVNTEESQS